MSAEKCNICGVFGTSTYRCCGNIQPEDLKKLEDEYNATSTLINDLKIKQQYLYLKLQKLKEQV